MPKRSDIHTILIIGSGPIVIGQACEFDYSGTQACKALREEGFKVVLVNSNPATIMTDPEFADVTYIEPLTVDALEKIIAAERPDALLPTLGGQTGLNLSMDLHAAGILDKYQVQMIGANPAAIEKGEAREIFKQAMLKIGLDVARSATIHSLAEALDAADNLIGEFPIIIRPSFTLGGAGGGIPTIARSSSGRSKMAWTFHHLRSVAEECYWAGRVRDGGDVRPQGSVRSSARSKTLTPWASILATRSPSHQR